jgi:hypothetical protein
VPALWRFFAGDSRIAPAGIAVALLSAALGVRLGFDHRLVAAAMTALLIATLGAACRE